MSLNPVMEGSPAPFIVGVPRSGTTLLRLMLDAHPQLAIGPETHFLPQLLVHRASADVLAETVSAIESSDRWLDFGLSRSELERAVLGAVPGTLDNAVRSFYRLYAAKFHKPRWGDKTPGYLLHMGAIHSLLPESRFIHIVRDGRDVALSIVPLWFGPDTIRDAALWWRERIVAARQQAASLTHYIEVRFEELLQAPEVVLQRICGFLELEYSPEMLRYADRARDRLVEVGHQLSGPGGTEIPGQARLDMHTRVSEPLDAERIGSWRSQMSQEDRREFHALAGDVLQALGYDIPLE